MAEKDNLIYYFYINKQNFMKIQKCTETNRPSYKLSNYI